MAVSSGSIWWYLLAVSAAPPQVFVAAPVLSLRPLLQLDERGLVVHVLRVLVFAE